MIEKDTIWLDTREFFNKKFEDTLLKKVLKIRDALDKRTLLLERKHWIYIDWISRNWTIQWVDYHVLYRTYEDVFFFTFEYSRNWESFEIDIEFEITKNLFWRDTNTHTLYFLREYINKEETTELTEKIEKLYYAMNKK